MKEKRLTEQVHEALAAVLAPGETVVDATAGNGRDTVVLARLVGPSGRVLAFDVQDEAIEQTRQALAAAGCARQATLLRESHAHLARRCREAGARVLGAAVFNLGFLPGADKVVRTEQASTLVALGAAWPLLRPGGLLSVLCYTGHAGGREETAAVRDWARDLPRAGARAEWTVPSEPARNPPELLLVHKGP